jgi:hypothetical protein
MGRNVPFGHQTLPPSGQKNHGSRLGCALHKTSNSTAVYARHTQIRNHNGEGFTSLLSGAERVNPRFTAVRGNHFMTIALQELAKRSKDQRVIITTRMRKREGTGGAASSRERPFLCFEPGLGEQ